MIKFEGQRDLLHLSGERNASCTKDVVSNAIVRLRNPLDKLRRLVIVLHPLAFQLLMLTSYFRSGLFSSFRVADLRAWGVLDLEDAVDLFKGKPGCLDIEEPNDRDPGEVEYGENNIEAPLNGFDAWKSCQSYR